MKSESGFSLLELMVAVGILGIVSFGVTTLFSSMNSQMFGINLKFEQFQLSTSIEAAMRNQISCKGVMNLSENNIEIPNAAPTSVVSLSRIAHINQSGVVIKRHLKRFLRLIRCKCWFAWLDSKETQSDRNIAWA
jgi:prepilin-type N-terminal cleavage/methylation domain-containing protein